MKRIISVLISLVLVLSLCACQKDGADKIDFDTGSIKIAVAHTDFEGMNIQIVNAIWTAEEIKLEVKWNNDTTYDVVYGESFDIEKQTNGEWKSCVTLDNLAFNDIGYELKAKSSQKQTYNLTDMFDISENGEYRFTTYCHVYDKGRGGESTKCEMWAAFTVSRTNDADKDIKKSFIDFDAQYIRTNGYHEDVKYPVVKVIRSVDELNAYYNTNKDKYNLERRSDPASDSTIGFLDAVDKYTAEYFEKQILVMVLLEEGSGSNRHNVDNVKHGSDGKLYVSIRRDVPEVGTCDMAEWHILIEPEKDITVASESDIVVYLDGVNPKTQPTTVYESGNFSNISLTIPHDWEYETEKGNSDGEYCIAFWPEDQTEGRIKMCYYTAFGVCGTGLEEKEITVGKYKAWQGTYDNKKVWDFISFRGMLGSYVAMNEGADKWWSQYGDEAMEILSTVKIAENILTEEQAIEIAKKQTTADYDDVSARFDTEKGIWTVTLSFKKASNGDGVHSYRITHEGKVLDAAYGD